MSHVEDAHNNNNKFTADQPGYTEDPGTYVEGNYGESGKVPSEEAGATEGQYAEGNYGTAGTEAAIVPADGEHVIEGRNYVRADAGTSDLDAEIPGEYTDTETS